MYQVYLSLGTNLGNRKRNIREVIEKIGEQIGVVERQMGRTMKSVDSEYHDRIIDIDILMIDDLVIDEPDFKVPHPLMEERDFVMKPLKEILK